MEEPPDVEPDNPELPLIYEPELPDMPAPELPFMEVEPVLLPEELLEFSSVKLLPPVSVSRYSEEIPERDERVSSSSSSSIKEEDNSSLSVDEPNESLSDFARIEAELLLDDSSLSLSLSFLPFLFLSIGISSLLRFVFV